MAKPVIKQKPPGSCQSPLDEKRVTVGAYGSIELRVRQMTACPACCSRAIRPISATARGFFEEPPDTGVWQPPYRIMRCDDCNLHFKSDAVPYEDLVGYYERLDFTPFELGYRFPTDAALLRALNQLPEGASILDFGCSTGRMLARLGNRYRRFGTEMNGDAAAVARRRGIAIIAEEELLKSHVGYFDAIILSDVFEHLFKPLQTLVELTRCLKPKGILAIVAGITDAIDLPGHEGEYWYFRLPGHLQMMSLKHAQWLSLRLGMREITISERISHYSPPFPVRVKTAVQKVIYAIARRRSTNSVCAVLVQLPLLRRSVAWEYPPGEAYRKDHVIVLMRKSDC